MCLVNISYLVDLLTKGTSWSKRGENMSNLQTAPWIKMISILTTSKGVLPHYGTSTCFISEMQIISCAVQHNKVSS